MSKLSELISSDIPFARDDAHRMLPAMVACLVGFTALLLAAAVSLAGSVTSQSRVTIGTLQVEIPAARAENKPMLETVMTEIRRTAGVEKVVILDKATMQALLTPWLGKDFSLSGLPVPVILEVSTNVRDNTTAVNVPALQTALRKIDAGITIKDQGPWVGHVVQASAFLQTLVIVVALLLMACVIGMIVLVARTNLKLHFKTVSLLHMFGATDDYILKQFQWNSAWLAGRGAVTGVLFAGLIFTAVVMFSTRWHSPVLPEVDFSPMHGVMFIVLPVFTALVALVSTRFTVQSMLHHLR